MAEGCHERPAVRQITFDEVLEGGSRILWRERARDTISLRCWGVP